MNDREEQKFIIGRPVEVIFGIALALISAGLIILSIVILFALIQNVSREFAIAALGWTGSFALLFMIMALRILRKQSSSAELMSLKRWRLLALSMGIIGFLAAFFGHWVGSLVPISIGLICLSKDEKFREKMLYSLPF